MTKSKKAIVIEYIFDQLYDPVSGALSRTVVTAKDVHEAKLFCNEHRGTTYVIEANHANFMKDLVRGKNAAKNWPDRLRQLGYVGEQVTGSGRVFEFVRVVPGESEGLTVDYRPTSGTPVIPIQSLSLPSASKELGRKDESWLLQVAVNLRIIESHFAIGDNRQIKPIEINHLQMDVKLRRVQIDALFLALREPSADDVPGKVLITVEAKQGNQRILTEQIARQVKAAFESTKHHIVVPIAVAAIRGKGVYVVEFRAVPRAESATFDSPEFHRDAMYLLCPPVKGI